MSHFQIEYTVQLANALSELLDTHLLAWETPGESALDLLETRVTLRRLSHGTSSHGERLSSQAELLRLATRLKPDIVHFQNAYVWTTPFLPAIRRRGLVLTVHDPYPHMGRRDPFSFPAIAIQSREADAVIVHGEAQKTALRSRFRLPAEVIRVIPHGEFSFVGKGAGATTRDPHLVLFFGRISAYKGVSILLEAIPLIRRFAPEARFRLVGSGSLSSFQPLIHRIGGVEVLNRFVPRTELAREIQTAAVVVAPYVDASQSAVVITSESLGTPVVTTRVGGIPEDVIEGKTGILTNVGDASGLAEAVADLLSNAPKARRMGNAARQWMATERSWEKIALRTFELYRELT